MRSLQGVREAFGCGVLRQLGTSELITISEVAGNIQGQIVCIQHFGFEALRSWIARGRPADTTAVSES